MKHHPIACAAFVLALAACDQRGKNEPTPLGSASATVVSDDDVPVAEDFITETTAEVKEDNYAAELDKIEKEINAAE